MARGNEPPKSTWGYSMSALRIPMSIKLYKDGEMVHSTILKRKTVLLRSVQEKNKSEWTSGTIKVWYSKANDYWNAGDFTTLAEFEQLLAEFTERQLVEAFS